MAGHRGISRWMAGVESGGGGGDSRAYCMDYLIERGVTRAFEREMCGEREREGRRRDDAAVKRKHAKGMLRRPTSIPLLPRIPHGPLCGYAKRLRAKSMNGKTRAFAMLAGRPACRRGSVSSLRERCVASVERGMRGESRIDRASPYSLHRSG